MVGDDVKIRLTSFTDNCYLLASILCIMSRHVINVLLLIKNKIYYIISLDIYITHLFPSILNQPTNYHEKNNVCRFNVTDRFHCSSCILC